VTSPSQDLSSTRGKNLGTRLFLYWLNTHLIGSSGRLNASDWLMVAVVDVKIRLNISNLEKGDLEFVCGKLSSLGKIFFFLAAGFPDQKFPANFYYKYEFWL
jgi:hypothetical protein